MCFLLSFPSIIHKLNMIYCLVWWIIDIKIIYFCELFYKVYETMILGHKESWTTSTWCVKVKHHNKSAKPIIYNVLKIFNLRFAMIMWSVKHIINCKSIRIVIKSTKASCFKLNFYHHIILIGESMNRGTIWIVTFYISLDYI